MLGGIEYLGHVAAAGHVLLPAPWQFSQVTPWWFPGIVSHLLVRVGGKFLGDLFVTGGAGVRAHKVSVCRPGGGLARGFGLRRLSSQRRSAEYARAEQQHREHRSPDNHLGAAPKIRVTGK